jgi:hypothetical protein
LARFLAFIANHAHRTITATGPGLNRTPGIAELRAFIAAAKLRSFAAAAKALHLSVPAFSRRPIAGKLLTLRPAVVECRAFKP